MAQEITNPYIVQKTAKSKLPVTQKARIIWDDFEGQVTVRVMDKLPIFTNLFLFCWIKNNRVVVDVHGNIIYLNQDSFRLYLYIVSIHRQNSN